MEGTGLQQLIEMTVTSLVSFSSSWLIPVMLAAFGLAVSLRFLVYYTTRRHNWFAVEFEKRVSLFLEKHNPKDSISFYVVVKRLLEQTFYEVFEVRDRLKRRHPDMVMGMGDRVFLIKQGSAWLVRDTLRRIKHLRHTDQSPNLLQITKHLFQRNPCFNKVFGLVSASGLNDVLNLLPGVFIICGIFGTFLGIMSALPELGKMDLTNIDQTNTVMTLFLLKISFAMSTSILGILLSVVGTIFNTLFHPEKSFSNVVDKFENSLDTLWHLSDSNDLPIDIPDFNEYRDPLEALAEASLNEELNKGKRKKSEVIKMEPPNRDADPAKSAS